MGSALSTKAPARHGRRGIDLPAAAEWVGRNLGVIGAALALAAVAVVIAYDFRLIAQTPPHSAGRVTCRVITPPPGSFVVPLGPTHQKELRSSLRVDGPGVVQFWYRLYIKDALFVDFVLAPDGSWERTDGDSLRSQVSYDEGSGYWLVQNVRKTGGENPRYLPYTTPF